jgi:DNA-binding GntR family transcriptional regulator
MPLPGGPAAHIRKETLRDKIAARLREWILDGTLRPGERVVEIDVAARLDVSRAPLREALGVLEGQGLVRISPHRGATVTRLSEADIREIFEIREALETLAAKRVRASKAPDRAERLEGALDALREAAAAKDMRRFSEADLRFHRELWTLAGNAHLAEVLDELSTRFFGYEPGTGPSGPGRRRARDRGGLRPGVPGLPGRRPRALRREALIPKLNPG